MQRWAVCPRRCRILAGLPQRRTRQQRPTRDIEASRVPLRLCLTLGTTSHFRGLSNVAPAGTLLCDGQFRLSDATAVYAQTHSDGREARRQPKSNVRHRRATQLHKTDSGGAPSEQGWLTDATLLVCVSPPRLFKDTWFLTVYCLGSELCQGRLRTMGWFLDARDTGRLRVTTGRHMEQEVLSTVLTWPLCTRCILLNTRKAAMEHARDNRTRIIHTSSSSLIGG